MASLLSVNLARPRTNPAKPDTVTGIDKVPTAEAVAVRAPGPRGVSGLVGDTIGSAKHHGGDDQAVYAYAREDLDTWERLLGRTLTNGSFGENFTTTGVDVTGALVGERWHVGDGGLILEVTSPRTPCKTFAAFLEESGLIKTFTHQGMPGAYLRVIQPGTVRAGDTVTVVDRPDHDVTVGLVFRARLREPELLPRLLDVAGLAEETRRFARRRLSA